MPEEIAKDIKAKEEEVVKEENDLNQAIVAYGYGKGKFECQVLLDSLNHQHNLCSI